MIITVGKLFCQPLSVSIQITNPLNCKHDTNGVLQAIPTGGTTPYTFSWSENTENQTTQSASNLKESTYFVTVTDKNLDQATTSIALIAPQKLTGIETIENPTCFNEKNGSITLFVSGGTTPYTYLWNTNQTLEKLTELPQGTYSVIIQDNNGCDTTISTIILTEPEKLEITLTTTNVFCQTLGSASVEVQGGIEPYSYKWSTSETTNIIKNLGIGTYSTEIKDKNNCSETISFTISDDKCDKELIPSKVFTPNGDGINDEWTIGNTQYFPNAQYFVYDRRGQLVHSQKGFFEPWDGRFAGIIVPFATYYYVIIKDKENKNAGTVTGSVNIVK